MTPQELVSAEPRAQAVEARPPAAPPPRLKYVETIDLNAEDDSGGRGLLGYWEVMRRYQGALLIGCLFGALAGFLLSLPQTPIYRASTTLEIEALNENYLNLRDINPTAATSGFALEADMSTQVKVLESRSLLEQVVEKLRLDAREEFQYRTGRLATWRKELGLGPASPLTPREKAVQIAGENLTIRPSRKSRVVEIASDWPDPQLAADFANTLAELFIDRNLQVRWQSTQRTGEWLGRQLEDLRVKLEKSAERLQEYARHSGLMFTSEQGSVAEERLRQLQAELSRAQAERIARQSRLEMATVSPPEALPEILDSGPLKEYQIKLTDLRRGLADLTATFTAEHHQVQRFKAQIAELEQALESERGHVTARIQNEYGSARRRETLLASDYRNQARLVSEQSERAIQYNILQGEVETNRELYDNLLQRVKEASVASAMRASNIRVIDPARPPRLPYRPNHVLNALLGLMSGLLLAIASVLIAEHADRTLKQPGDSAQCLALPELGVIPCSIQAPAKRPKPMAKPAVLAFPRRLMGSLGVGHNGHGSAAGAGLEGDEVGLVCWRQRTTLAAECFRATVTSILFSAAQGERARSIVISSPSPGEGKTTVTSNLGICLAEIKGRVLLMDADMRKPRIHKVFGLHNGYGVCDLLRDPGPLDRERLRAAAIETEVPGLFVIPSGSHSPNIPNLLHSLRAVELLHQAEEEFGAVLIDTPPMLQISDARVLGRVCGAVVLVVRAGQTTRSSAKAAAGRFEEDGVQVLGTVLNSWNPKTNGYGYYDSYHRYDSYYADHRPVAAQSG